MKYEQKWLKAAERYEASKQPGFKARKKKPVIEKPTPTLAQFMANGEGEAARKLLAASWQDICLGYSKEVMGRTLAVIFDSEGLKTHSGVVGVAAAYTKEKPEQKLIDAAEAVRLIKSFARVAVGSAADQYFCEEGIVKEIREKLDSIAEDAP